MLCFPCNEPILSLDLQVRDWTSFKNIIKKLSGFPTPIWHYPRLDLWITQISACLRMYNIHKCHHAGNLWLKKMRNIEIYFWWSDSQIPAGFQIWPFKTRVSFRFHQTYFKIEPDDCFWQEDPGGGELVHVGEYIWMIVIEWDLL